MTARWAAGAVLAAAVLLHLLLFVRVAGMYAPDYYLGPSGSDRVFYYAYVRSLVFDGDLDFRNEMALRPPSTGLVFDGERPVNKYPIGAPLVSLPGVAALRAAAVASGRGANQTGYERAYAVAYALAPLVLGSAALLLLWRIASPFAASPLAAAFAAAGALLATGLLRYTAADLMMSHAVAMAALTWCTWESYALDERPARWFRVGLASGFVVIVRLQNVVYLLVPAIAVGLLLRRRVVRGNALVAAVAGGLLPILLQVLTWRVASGRWMLNSYSAESRFTWAAPHVVEGLALVAPWWPVMALTAVGCVAASIRHRHWLPLATLAVSVLGFYVGVSWWAWDVVSRTTFENLPAVAIGLAGLPGLTGRGTATTMRALVLTALLAAWNLPLLFMSGAPADAPPPLTAQWLEGVRTMVGRR